MADANGPIPKIVLVFVILAVALGIASLVLNILILSKENEKKQGESTETISRPTSAPAAQPVVSNSTGFKVLPNKLQLDWIRSEKRRILRGGSGNPSEWTRFQFRPLRGLLYANPLPSGTNRVGTYSDTQRQVNNAIVLALNTSDNLLSNTEKILQKLRYQMKIASVTLDKNDAQAKVFTSCMTLPSAGRSARVHQLQPSVTGLVPLKLIDCEPSTSLQHTYAPEHLFLSYDCGGYPFHPKSGIQSTALLLMMARDYYVKPHFIDYLDTYLDSLIDTIRQFKADIQSTVPDETIVQEATEAAELELSLALASVPSDLLRNFEQQYNPTTHRGEPSHDEYIIQQPSYFGTLNTILAGKQYSKRTLVNFIMMRFLQNNLDFLGNGTDQYSRLFEIIRSGQGGMKKRPEVAAWEDQAYSCYVYLKGIDANLRDNVRKDIAKQTEYVIERFLDMIATLPWLTSTSLDSARRKAQGLIKNYGWPDWFDFNDSTSIDAYHIHYNSILNMSDWWDITNALQYASQVTENFGTLEKEPDRYDFPQAYNYGGQGGTVGHELTHGVQFGPTGELYPCVWNHCGWMDKNSTSGFINMAQCIFWIAYGYTWCMNMSTEYLTRLLDLLLTNPHAPGMCRVNQVMQDIPDFALDFNCQRGSSMYPPDTQRCQCTRFSMH
uniref:Uncharacterized protein n=1 Tax=Parascaris equorum TaxID=6256 RepID=A0A914RM77_PAREQ